MHCSFMNVFLSTPKHLMGTTYGVTILPPTALNCFAKQFSALSIFLLKEGNPPKGQKDILSRILFESCHLQRF